MKRAGIFLLSLLLSGTASWAQYDPLTVPDLPNLEVRRVERAKRDSLKMGNLPAVERRAVNPPERLPLQIAQFPEVQHRRVVAPEISNFIGPQLPRVELLSIAEFKDFKAGLDLNPCKTKIPPDRAIVLENALWNEQGEMYKRPGCSEHSTPPFDPNFLYRYYQQDGDKYLMGGSDTSLHFWHEDSSGDGWTYLIGTEGTSGRWDGTTFEDMFVGTHLGVQPVFWDGDSIVSVTVLESADSFFVEWSNIVMDTAYTDCYRFKTVFTLTSPPAAFETNELVGYTFEWYKHVGSSEIQRMLVLSNTTDEIYATLPCSLDLVPDKAERWCWLRPWFHSTSVDSGTSDSVTVCYDDPNYCCFRPGDYAASVRFWDSDLDTLKLKRDWSQILAVTDSRGNVWRNYIGNHQAFGVTGGEPWVVLNGWMVACFNEETEYEIYELSSALEDEGIKYTETFDDRLWFGWTGTGVDQSKNGLIYSKLRKAIFLPENDIYLTPGDGDYITGMKSLSDARHVDVPSHLLMVTKNASSYKIVPTSTAGVYDSWYISSRVGCVSNSAMSVGEGLVLFPDQDGVWAWDQRSKPQCISLLIDPIFEDLELENLEDMSAIYNPQDRHYYLSGPELFEIDTVIYIGDFIVDFIATNDIWTHRIDSAGVKMGTPDTLAATYAGVYDQRIATDTAGRYVISYLLGATPYIQKFGADDQEVGDSIRVCDVQRMTNAVSVGAEVTMDNDGNIIVCWADTTGGDFGNIDIYCQYVDWDDGKVDTNFVVNSNWETNDKTQTGAHGVEINNNGLFVVTWQDTRDAEIDPLVSFEVYGQRYQVYAGDSVHALGSNFNISAIDGAGAPFGPDVSVSNDHFVVVWQAFEGESAKDVWKRLYTIDGSALEDRTVVNVEGDSGDNHWEARVDMNDWGEYVIVYLNSADLEDPYNVQFRKYDLTTAVGGEVEPMAQNSPLAVYPDVALANNRIFVVVWSDMRVGPAHTYTFYQAYRWQDTLSANVILTDSSVLGTNDLEVFIDMPDFMNIDTSCYTLAWNIDYKGWSEESFTFSAIEYQHGLTDPVKVIFADPEETKVYNYGTQADDVDDAVVLTYQSPYMSFTQYPYWENFLRYVTVEVYLDTGTIYLDFYVDYSTLVHQDSIMCGTDCREEIQLPDSLYGKNLSVKVTTGSTIDEFYLSKYWWEYNLKKERD